MYVFFTKTLDKPSGIRYITCMNEKADTASKPSNEEQILQIPAGTGTESDEREDANLSLMDKRRSRLLRKLLRELRARYDESLAGMAKRLGISVSLLSSIENGSRFPPDGFMERVIEEYRLRGREKENLIVADTIASDAPIEFEMGDRQYSEKFVRVALFLANALAEADIETLWDVCKNIENAVAQKKTGACAPEVSDRKEMPIYLPDGWTPPEDDFVEDETERQPFVPIRLRTDSKERRLRRNRNSRHERSGEEEQHDGDN